MEEEDGVMREPRYLALGRGEWRIKGLRIGFEPKIMSVKRAIAYKIRYTTI